MATKKRNKKLKRLLIVIGVLAVLFFSYVAIVNRNSKQMSYRQKVLKAIYPAFMWVNHLVGAKSKAVTQKGRVPPVSIYDLSVQLNNGQSLALSTLKGKKILLVNTASDCGYTGQYSDLQALYEANKDGLVVIGFPANDFKEQEKGTDDQIASFCKLNYGVTFPLASKSSVIKGAEQNTIFHWLTDKSQNGWNEQAPTWNFSKYLVDESGALIGYFDPSVSPSSNKIKEAIH